MISAEKRILILTMLYLCNCFFVSLCLYIGSGGFLFSVCYEVAFLVQICLLLVPVSFCELCLVLGSYYKREKVFGDLCIPMDFRKERQCVVLTVYYVSAFIVSFFLSLEGMCFYLWFFLMCMIVVNGTETGRVLWRNSEEVYYITNGIGEVYPVKEIDKSERKWSIIYMNSKMKECRIKSRRNNEMHFPD